MISLRTRAIRFLTSLAVVAVCALALLRGWDLVRFGVIEAGLNSEADWARAVDPWIDVSGLAFSAREYALTVVDDPGDAQKARQRRDELTEILAVRPLSSDHWLSLADMRLASGERSRKVTEALGLSMLTGANERYVKLLRGLFGVAHWEVLPAEFQRRTANDLATERLSNRVIAMLQTALSEKPEKIRQDIRATLLAQGVSPKDLITMGL